MGVVCAVLLALAAAGAEGPGLPERMGVSMTPTAKLDALRFVHRFGAESGRLFVEIDMDERYDELKALAFEWYSDWYSVPAGTPEVLTAERAKAVAERLGVAAAARYVVVLPFVHRVVAAESKGLALYYEPAGPSLTLCHAIDIDGPLGVTEHGTAGVAFASDVAPEAIWREAEALSAEERDRLTPIIAQAAGEAFGHILQASLLPGGEAALATARVGESDILYWAARANGSWRVIPLTAQYGNGGLAVEERPGAFCGAMQDSRIAVLPDLNGDGTPEVFVDSTVSWIVDPAAEGDPVLRTAYFGP